MQIYSLSIDGLSALPHFEWRADSHSSRLNGPLPKVTAVQDALSLAFAVFSADSLTHLLKRWGWSPQDVVESDGRAVEAHWDHEELAHRFVVDQPNPRVQIHLGLELSANVLADLRRWTLRQPELQLALLEAPTIRMSISCEFSQRRHFMRISVGGIFLGNEKMDLSTEPHWLPQLWQHMAGAFATQDSLVELAQQAAQAAFSEWSRKIPELCGSPSRAVPTAAGSDRLVLAVLGGRTATSGFWSTGSTVHFSGCTFVFVWGFDGVVGR